LARAKNTSRAEARRRARVAMREEREVVDATEAGSDPGTESTAAAAAGEPPRQPFFRAPRFREDLRLLPHILTSRRLMIVPPLMLLLGFALTLIGPGLTDTEGGLPLASVADLYVQLFFLPPALLTFFLAGFIAPRASYLVGAVLGTLSGILWAIILAGGQTMADPMLGEATTDLPSVIGYLFLLNVGYGTFAAAFAAWYRDFLRRMQDQGRARRADREAKERAKRRDQRHEDRRTARRGTR